MKRLLPLFSLLTLLVSGFGQEAGKKEPLSSVVPETMKAELNIVYGKTPEQELKMDVYRPKAGGILPVCVLIHGGGWTGGDKEKFTPLAIALAAKGYVVANAEYRLAGAAKYPAAVQDCFLAVRFVRANAIRFEADAKRIGTWGGSAGGHLVAMLAGVPAPAELLPAELPEVSAEVQATCIMAGPTDLTNETFVESLRRAGRKGNSYEWLGKLYDEAPELYRAASPITHFSRETGPVLFITGALDNPERDTAGMEKLRVLGVPTKQLILAEAKHGCWMQHPWFEQCIEAVDGWFQQYLK